MEIFNKLHWKPVLTLLGYPLFLAFVLELLFQEISFSSYLNFIENFLFFLIVLLAVNLFSNSKIGRFLISLLIVFFYAILFIETGLYLLFQTRINAAYIHVFLNTNLDEVREFSSIYFKNNLIWLGLFFIPIFNFFPKKIFKNKKYSFKDILLNIFLILGISSILKFTHLTQWNFPFVTIKSYFQYQQQLKVFDDFNKRDVEINANLITDNDVIVVIIGESTTSKHMGIYGYHRNTTPRLNKLSDSLIVYKDVISSHAFTTESIFDAFTFSDGKKTAFLLDYIKNAGYKTYWLSNQRPVGFYDNMVSRIASGADESLFLSYNDFRHKTLLDEVLLPMIDKKLEKKEKKVIFAHLIGTHYDYEKRYSPAFNKFVSKVKNEKNSIIDTYDNAVLYNDYIISEIIKKVQSTNQKSAVIYFSDHGEEVFDTVNYFGHFEDKPTKTMYEVPFFIYMSSDFETPKDFLVDIERPYILEDFTYSLTHFLGIESQSLKKEKSIFSTSFINKPRIVSDSINYESLKQK